MRCPVCQTPSGSNGTLGCICGSNLGRALEKAVSAPTAGEPAPNGIDALLEQAIAEGAPRRPDLTSREQLEQFVDIVWHGDKEVLHDNPWSLRLNQLWLNAARGELAKSA